VAGRHTYFAFTNQGPMNGKVHKNNILYNGPSHNLFNESVHNESYKRIPETNRIPETGPGWR
jgi:hypothetical protein